jgi:hypothetical protein
MRAIPILLCMMLFAAPACAQECKLVEAASLPITNLGDIPVVTATLDGAPAPLSFSLGDSMDTLNQSYVDAHKFEIQRANYGNVRIITGSNWKEMSLATVHQFSLGPVKGTDMDFLVTPDSSQPSSDLVGVLSQSSLASFDFELDIQGKKLNLFLQSHCPGQVVYWPTSVIARLPFFSTDMDGRFEMQLDGKSVRVLLSPQSSTSMIGSNTLHRIFGIDLDSPGVERIAGSPDDAPRYSYHFSTLGIDALTIRNPGITIFEQKGVECLDKPNLGLASRLESEAAPGCFGGHDLVLGASVLRQLRLFFANKERMLYVTPTSAH